MKQNCYADDTQVNMVFIAEENWVNCVPSMEPFIADIGSWMKSSLLRLNQGKTQLILFFTK